MDDFLTLSEASKIARVSLSTLERAARRRVLVVVRIGRSVRVRREALEAFLRSCEVAA